jgi:2-iminobutanoate/2-iminopropanoate deaminase
LDSTLNREVRTENAPAPIGPYSQAVETAGGVYCAGQIGYDPKTGKLEEGIAAQTKRALDNLEEVLKAARLNLKYVARTTVFMTDLSEFPQMNEEYAKRFAPPFPARSTVQVAALPRGAKVEIDAIAVRA